MGETLFFLFIGTFEKCLEMGETLFLLFIGTFEKCLEMGETHFLLFIGTFEKCLEMGETQFLLFIGTFGGNGKIITFVTHRPTAPIIYKSLSSSPGCHWWHKEPLGVGPFWALFGDGKSDQTSEHKLLRKVMFNLYTMYV